MDAKELIEAYVTEVATELPRGQRDDVAFELRALLNEELQARAEGAGRPADAAMAKALLQAFGVPAEVAARYRPTLTIIDPVDGHAFLRASVIGLVVIWVVGLLAHFSGQSFESVEQFLGALGQWWGRTLIASMWWPGVLVVGFAIASWSRRNSPRDTEWTPRDGERITGGRVGLAFGIFGMAFGAFVLWDPRWILDAIFGGLFGIEAAPIAYTALTYTEGFLSGAGPWLYAAVLLNVPFHGAVLINGRWTPTLRRAALALGAVTCMLMAWAVLDGPILMTEAGDSMAKALLVLVAAFSLFGMVLEVRREVRPKPDLGAAAGG